MATGLENLKIYQMARDLELKINEITKTFPLDEKYRSVDQLKRSSTAVTNNIAEAYYKSSTKEKIHIFRDIVITEAEETRSNILRCALKGFLSQEMSQDISNDYTEFKKAVHGYIRFLKDNPYKFY